MIERQRTARPFMVTLIALFLFARGALILLIAFSTLRADQLPQTTLSAVQVVTLNALYFILPRSEARVAPVPQQDSEGEQHFDTLRILMTTPIAILSAYIGFSLLLRKKSGRALAIVWSVFTVLFWARGLLLSSAFNTISQMYFTSAQTKSNIFLALFFNGFIVLYLMYGNGVAHAFGQPD